MSLPKNLIRPTLWWAEAGYTRLCTLLYIYLISNNYQFRRGHVLGVVPYFGRGVWAYSKLGASLTCSGCPVFLSFLSKMVDFFRSAMSYLSGEGEAGGGSGGGNAFVGQTVDIGDGMKLKVKKVIAEGRPLPLNPSLFPLSLSLSRWLWVCFCCSRYKYWD